jgi:hypothetical protein
MHCAEAKHFKAHGMMEEAATVSSTWVGILLPSALSNSLVFPARLKIILDARTASVTIGANTAILTGEHTQSGTTVVQSNQ